MNLRTGDIITSTASSNPLLNHKAIVVIEDDGTPWCVHNSPMILNEAGGSVGYEPLSDFLQLRKILRVEPTALSKEHIIAMGESLAHKRFDILSFNSASPKARRW